MKNRVTLFFAVCALASGGGINPAQAQSSAPTCDTLVWSAQMLAENPDIRESCQEVFQRRDELFAKVTIEVTRASGNRLAFRPVHLDGSLGKTRSITVPSEWRARLDGESVRARDLLPGQRLNVYVPEDRFALTVEHDLVTKDEEPEPGETEGTDEARPR